jgi:spermidine synthase
MKPGRAAWPSLALMAASGFAGLGYQIVWTQQCAAWLGHESAAMLAVVAAIFGGLAVGALALGPRIERSAAPLRWYAGCEAAIAAWAGVLTLAMPGVGEWLLQVTGPEPTPLGQWAIAFSGTFVLLLPATAAMGATLPAMERLSAQLGGASRSIAAHYASNTLGAMAGVLATAFWLVPALGLTRTAAICIAANAACALASLRWLPTGEPARSAAAVDSSRQAAVLWSLAITGLLGIGYEVLVVRVLSQVAEDTVYTFALLLAVYLLGTALGAAGWQRWRTRIAHPRLARDRLLCALAAACLAGAGALWGAQATKDALMAAVDGGGMAAAVAVEGVLALTAFLLPTFAMGALFSHLSAEAGAEGIGFGRAIGVNTLGAAFAPPLFGVWLAPAAGPGIALILVAAGYLALVTPRAWRRPLAWIPAAAALALFVWAPRLAFIEIPEGGQVVSYREGALAAVSVVADADGVSRLRIDNRQQEGSSATLLVDARQALLPVLLHPAPRHALFLGLGTGMTAASAAGDTELQVDAVELLPEVIAASEHFTQALDGGAPNPRLRLTAADARRFVRATDRRYDVIVSDNFHPARSGSGALYTVEHFRAVQGRLAPAGVFCQWLPLHQLDLATLRSIVQSFITVFPRGTAILASNSLETPVIGLVGRADDGRFDLDALRRRLAAARFTRPIAASGITDEYALLGSFVAGPRALARFAGSAPANTDDHPVVTYLAPSITYAPDSLPRDRLIDLLGQWTVAPEDVLRTGADADATRRLAAYWAARDRFITAGRDVRPMASARDMLAQVGDPLLAVLRTSPDFRPAYDPLLRMALALADTDARSAAALLGTLARLQPARPEAGDALRQLGTGPH